MSTTKTTTTKTEATEAPSFIDRAEALASDPSALAALAEQATTAAEAEHVLGLMALADDRSAAVGTEASVQRYHNMGRVLTIVVRERINSGQAKTTKGATRDPLASGTAITFADVKDAIPSLRESGGTWTPNVPNVRPMARTECQRYWEASTLTPARILAARSLVKPEQVNNARILVEQAAQAERDAAKPADKRAADETKRAEREQAKADKEAATKRAEATMTEARHPDQGGVSLIGPDMLAEATLADLLATEQAMAEAITKRLAEAEARYQAEANQDAMIAALALARGVSVEQMAAAMAALPTA